MALVGIGTNEHILKEVASVFRVCHANVHVGSKLHYNLPTHVIRVFYQFCELSKLVHASSIYVAHLNFMIVDF